MEPMESFPMFNENRNTFDWMNEIATLQVLGTKHNKNLMHIRDYLGIFHLSSLSDAILLLWALLNIVVFIDFIDQDSFF